MNKPNETRPMQDLETNEVHIVAFPKIKRHGEPFTIVFCDPLRTLLRTQGRRFPDDTPLRPVDMRVLLYLIASTGFENEQQRYVSDIADELDHDRSTVSKALDALEDRELVQVVRNAGRPHTVHLTPALCYRGRQPQRAKTRRERWSGLRRPAALVGSWLPAGAASPAQ